jgi:predicted DNA-binding ribbon-helix-helix protein
MMMPAMTMLAPDWRGGASTHGTLGGAEYALQFLVEYPGMNCMHEWSHAPQQSESRLVTRNVGNGAARTSMRFEPEVWDALREICEREGISLDQLVARAVRANPGGGRTSAVRVFAVSYFRRAMHSSVQAR